MRKITMLSVVTMVLPHKLCWYSWKMTFLSGWNSVIITFGAWCTQKFLYQVSFPRCCDFSHLLANGERSSSLAVAMWPRSHKAVQSLSQENREVQQKLDWSRGAREKGAGTRSVILVNETRGHLDSFHKLEKVSFYLDDRPNTLLLHILRFSHLCFAEWISGVLWPGS